MKRFLLFAGETYYPGGGWDDFVDDYDTLEEAEAKAKTLKENWWDIVDTTTKTKVGDS